MLITNKTKIIATIGPSINNVGMLEKLIDAGTSMFRLNTSHSNIDAHLESLKTIRVAAKNKKRYIPILVDLQGPKIRVGNLLKPIALAEKQIVTMMYSQNQIDNAIIPIDYEHIVKDVNVGEKMLLDDGKLELKVISINAGKITAEVIYGGVLKSRKGLNLPGTQTSASSLTSKDIEYIKFAMENNVDYLALSFVRSKDDILFVKNYLKVFGGDIPIIAKIEKPQALDNIDGIIKESDGIMVARGDLGIELYPHLLPVVQKELIKKANQARKITIVATQMLESMVEQPMPTRAEASDVANAIIDGADAIMLSGETSVGLYPLEAVSMMALIAQNVEQSQFLKTNLHLSRTENYHINSQAIVSGIVKMVEDLEVSAIISFTKTGYSPRLISKERPSVPVICVTDNEKTCNQLSLYWGLFPIELDCDGYICEKILQKINEILVKKTFLKNGDKVVFAGSIPHLLSGKTNFIRIHEIGKTFVE